MLGGFGMEKSNKLIKISINFILKDLNPKPDRLNKLVEKLIADYESGKLLISDEQWYHIIVLVGAITQHDAERISGQVSELESKGHITGKLRELIDLSTKFKNPYFK
jgi:hypothetical protein